LTLAGFDGGDPSGLTVIGGTGSEGPQPPRARALSAFVLCRL